MSERGPEIDEQTIVASFERDEWQTIPSLEQELENYQVYASAALANERRVSIDLKAEDLATIRQKAREEGVSYQTYIAQIVHRYVRERLLVSAD